MNSLLREPLAPTDSPEEIAHDIAAVGQIQAVPTILEVLCKITGMRFAAVARVTDKTWTACAVKDDIQFGLVPGGQLEVSSTLCIEARAAREPIVIDHASQDLKYRNHHTPRIYHIESYVSVPIILKDGRYFGNLCAIDPAPAKVSETKIVDMFTSFAALIALQLEAELHKETIEDALRDERQTAELRDQFIAILGHDLRNPLQAIYATGALLEKKIDDPALISLAARIRTNVKRMTGLIDDVLDFARGRLGGGIGLRLDDSADCNACLEAVVKELQDGQPTRQILSNISVTKSIRCDMGRVQQVASNLIGNALAHGAPDSPVKVSATNDDRDFVLTVWNAGAPIPPESIAKIFEPFWRNSTSGQREGLGLGLHICSQIVNAHHGKLAVTSTAEGGTEFTARLPLQSLS